MNISSEAVAVVTVLEEIHVIMKTYLQSFPNMPVPKTYTCSTG